MKFALYFVSFFLRASIYLSSFTFSEYFFTCSRVSSCFFLCSEFKLLFTIYYLTLLFIIWIFFAFWCSFLLISAFSILCSWLCKIRYFLSYYSFFMWVRYWDKCILTFFDVSSRYFLSSAFLSSWDLFSSEIYCFLR